MSKQAAASKKSVTDRLIFGMFVAYSIFLAWAVLWKCGVPFIGDGTQRSINWLPFNHNTRWEMQFNVAIFVPFGFYLAAVREERPLLRQILVVLLTSLLFEALQFVLAIGRSDITDLILDTLGGMIGIAAFYLLSKLCGRHQRMATLVVCVLLTLLVLYMAVSFVLIGQVNLGYMIIRL